MANFPAISITEMPQEDFPVDVQALIAATNVRFLIAEEWLVLFENADLFGAPINPYRIPPDTAGLWRVDNPHNFDLNEWIPEFTSIERNVYGEIPPDLNDIEQRLMFHAREAIGMPNFDYHDNEIIHDAFFHGPAYRLNRLTVRNHQDFLELQPTVTFAHYWFELFQID